MFLILDLLVGARGRLTKVRAIGVVFLRFVDFSETVLVGRYVDVDRDVVGGLFVAMYVVCVRRDLGFRTVAMVPLRANLGVRLPEFKAARRF